MSILDFKAHLADYGKYHTHIGNRLCHLAGIPLIMIAIIRWTQWPALAFFPVAALVLILYFLWNARLALAMTGVIAAMTFVASNLSSGTIWTCFIVGWIFQFVGHAVFENKSPAFMRNLVHLLVGPMWILRELTGLGR